MSTASETIILGCVSGILTTLFIFLLSTLFTNTFLPWYRHAMYRGIKIDGSWHAIKLGQKTLLELTQSCEKIEGKATIHITHSALPVTIVENLQLDDIRTFDVKGEVFERFLRLTLTHTDKKRIGLTTYLLQIEGDGTRISGEGCWYAPQVSRISSGEKVFFRDESRAVKFFENKKKQQNQKANKSSQKDATSGASA